ncbi:tRNA wybutosine-synthesizing protein 3 homolog isoform X2 [Dysidea avara]|uniref:tRNA wybutosine-synthesizing protein 3 homolog isoform X2 n=1 Tax=Dysidea avara TaxID=196820 RepID=UPI00332B7C21
MDDAGASGGDKSSSSSALFQLRKEQILRQVDLSRKGSIDNYIVSLVECINTNPNYVTTSSCSGRIVIYCEKKKGCQWLLVNHKQVTPDEVVSCLSQELPVGYVIFKFEPFVLHVLCATLEAASDMHQLAVMSGFRNSGISISKKNKIMLAVRSTLVLEVPIAVGGKLMVDHKYLSHLVEVANDKMVDNNNRIDRFYDLVKPRGAYISPVTKSKPSGDLPGDFPVVDDELHDNSVCRIENDKS